LIGLINTVWMMAEEPALSLPKGAMAGAATISVYKNTPTTIIPNRFLYLAPTLKSLPRTIPTLLGTNFCFALDNWQL
jgi:hypothetical protein